jgi:hypothetical protein
MVSSHVELAGSPLRPSKPLLAYLDLNKWIDLAHAEVGTERGKQYLAALQTAGELVQAGRVIFPLSFSHFAEVSKIGNDEQRRTLARLMVRLSGGWFLPSTAARISGELRRAIAAQFGKAFPDPGRIVLTRSVKAAVGDPAVIDSIGGFSEALFFSPAILEELIATARAGPETGKNFRTYADQHEATRAIRWDSSRAVRKRVYCAQVQIAILDRFLAVLGEFGLPLNVLEALGPDGCVALLESVPPLDVEINLFVERNEQRDRKIAPNDEFDLAFLCVAVPYCHAVITEKFWASLARRVRLDQKYQTIIGWDLNECLSRLSL